MNVELKTFFQNLLEINEVFYRAISYLSKEDGNELAYRLMTIQNKRENILTNPLKIVLAGNFSSGKSLFLNSLLGEAIVPYGDEPMTLIPCIFRNGAQTAIEVEDRNGQKRQIDVETFNQIKHTSKEEIQIEDIEDIKIINFYYNSPLLMSYSIIDTPGFSTASEKGDDRLTESIIINSADVLLWVTDINSGELSHSELEILEKLKGQKPNLPIVCILNKCDMKGKPNTDKVQNIVREVKKQLEINDVYPISSEKIFHYEKEVKRGIDQNILELIHNSKSDVTIIAEPDKFKRKVKIIDSNNRVIREDDVRNSSEWLEPFTKMQADFKDLAQKVNTGKKITLYYEILEWKDHLERCLNKKKKQLKDEIEKTSNDFKVFSSEVELVKQGTKKKYENIYLLFSNIAIKEIADIVKNHVSINKIGLFDDMRKVDHKKLIDKINVEPYFKSLLNDYLFFFESEITQVRTLLSIHSTIMIESSCDLIEKFLEQLRKNENLLENFVKERIATQFVNVLSQTISDSSVQKFPANISDEQIFYTIATQVLEQTPIRNIIDMVKESAVQNMEQIKDTIQISSSKKITELDRKISDIEEIINYLENWRESLD